MRFGLSGLALMTMMSVSARAPAQETIETPTEGAAPNASALPTTPRGMRFRFGVSAGAGPLLSSLPTFIYGGADLRFGLQMNDLFGIYLQPQLGFYGGGGGNFAAFGGLIGGSVLGEVTFWDRLFVGGGLGYGILNNPSGLELHFRAGAYPAMSKSDTGRRKGLMLGVDFRVHLLDVATFIAPTFCIGYESF
jgi:hypothetical protein